ncbi:hypothetical protein Sango_1310500 [Sesamum angolense]|uniref:Uncharacterized protein n=1 Tax=Sesamum angolense TaxID=2727404 RepID=A0AAE1WRU4_9LAMI|nr:hypothetical protein Sango_1310500 [Sesamum angolense]
MGAQEMGLTWKEEHLDFVLVPSGLLIMLGYHLFHLHRCINRPVTTVIGYENHNRRAWVARILQLEAKERSQAITVIGSNLSAATSLASISLALSSLIGAWIGSAYHNNYTARCFVHANFLISTPNCEMPVRNVESAVISGSNFWVAGLRSLYFATNLLLWIFGPIPMFVCSVITVLLLHYLDKNSTPLPPYNPPLSYDDSKKIHREMKASPGTTEHHEESQDHRDGT